MLASMHWMSADDDGWCVAAHKSQDLIGTNVHCWTWLVDCFFEYMTTLLRKFSLGYQNASDDWLERIAISIGVVGSGGTVRGSNARVSWSRLNPSNQRTLASR